MRQPGCAVVTRVVWILCAIPGIPNLELRSIIRGGNCLPKTLLLLLKATYNNYRSVVLKTEDYHYSKTKIFPLDSAVSERL